MTALTELHDEILDALERAGYPHVAICRIDEGTYGAAAFCTLRELALIKPGDFVGRGKTRQEALWGVLERVA